MRYALRRLLWVIPNLLALSIIGFWLVSQSLGGGVESTPRFFNPSPNSLKTQAEILVQQIAQGGVDAPQAGQRLAQLGGASLPFVLPRLDTLSPSERSQVAVALAPLGVRMGVAEAEELSDPQAAAVFWHRFWQDRALDFRDQVVRRAVTRLATKSSALRLADIKALDTHALPELFSQLKLPETEAEIAQTAPLIEAIAHISERGVQLKAGASLAEAQRVVLEYRSWWQAVRLDYTNREGLGLALATIRDTAYGNWLTSSVVYRADELYEQLASASWRSFLLTWPAWAGSLVIFWLGSFYFHIGNFRLSYLVVAAAAVPCFSLLLGVGPIGYWLMLLYGGARALVLTRIAALGKLDLSNSHTEKAFGLSSRRLSWRRARLGFGYYLADLPAAIPSFISASLLVELATGESAIARRTLLAIETQDIGWVMALLIWFALVVALTQILSDLGLRWLDPRLKEALERREGRAT